ncbi:putative minor capsid protein [Bacillus sp. OTU530]|uniref:putative minor capsid protein n=1 Tax=Bacillus sp. OTU530 TaxID=3043862 RepID=UPI00313D4F97
MRVRPIPLAVLIHSVEYQEYTGNARWGETYKESVILQNVRIFPGSYLRRGIREDVRLNTFMIYDCTNSTPRDITFVEKSKIVFGGKEMMVQRVNEQYASEDAPHHFEVLLQ